MSQLCDSQWGPPGISRRCEAASEVVYGASCSACQATRRRYSCEACYRLKQRLDRLDPGGTWCSLCHARGTTTRSEPVPLSKVRVA